MIKKSYVLMMMLCCGLIQYSQGHEPLSDKVEYPIFRRFFPNSFGLRFSAVTAAGLGAFGLAKGLYDLRQLHKKKNDRKMLLTEYESKKNQAKSLITGGALISGCIAGWLGILLYDFCKKRNKPMLILTSDWIKVGNTIVPWDQVAKWQENIKEEDCCETDRNVQLLNKHGKILATIDLHMIGVSRKELYDLIYQHCDKILVF